MTVDSGDFRRVLGHFATGVTVVTTRFEERLYGFTANAFMSISLDPPLIAIAVGNGNASRAAIEGSGVFCVNLMARDQMDLVRCFATNGPEKYEHFCAANHHTAMTGAPIIEGSLGWIDCRVSATYPGGDHQIVLGEVQALESGVGQPLIYYRARYVLNPRKIPSGS